MDNVRHINERRGSYSHSGVADIDLGIPVDPEMPDHNDEDVKGQKTQDAETTRALALLAKPVNAGWLTGFQRFLIKKIFFTSKAKADIIKSLASYARMRVPASRALEMIFLNQSEEGRKPNNPIAFVARDWRYNFSEKSMPMGTAAADWLSKEEVVLINAGAGTPKFLESLEACLFIMENKGKISKEMRKAFIGPAMSLAMAFGLPVVFVDYLLPAVKVMPHFSLNGNERQIAGVGKFIIHDWLLVAVTLAAVIVSIVISMPRLTGRLRVRLDKIPPWGFYRVVQGSNFMLTMAALTSSGISMTDAVRKIRDNKLSPYMRERVMRTLGFMEQGEKLGTALWRTGLQFPDKRTVQNLKSFEEDVEFTRMLSDMAREAITTNTEIITKQSRTLAMTIGIFAAYVMITFLTAIQSVMLSASSMH